jgi:transcriptional regulator with XRE-family HTH domain
MGTGQILKTLKRERNLSDDDIATIFGLTRARWNQYLQGQPIPIERIRAWSRQPDLPDWARILVNQLWLATIEAQFVSIGEQIQELGTVVADCA